LLLAAGAAGGCAGKIVAATAKDTATATDAGDGRSDAGLGPDEDGGLDEDLGPDASMGSLGPVRDAGPMPPIPGNNSNPASLGLVPLFVAVGEMGRTTVSCDDGRSWVGERAATETPCSGSECDHSQYANSGLTYSAEGHRWFSSRGWGYDGPLEYTDDGESWTTVPRQGRWDGLVAGGGSVYVQADPALRSDDFGLTFREQDRARPMGFVRGTVFYADQLFWMLSDRGEIFKSADRTATWSAPKAKESRCSQGWQMNQGGLAAGNGVVVMVSSGQGVVCRSTDRGETFDYVTTFPENTASPLFFADGRFWVYSGNVLHRSRDGMSWENTSVDNFNDLRPVARSDMGTWVAVQGVYEDQRFGRSTDGVRWEVLSNANHKRSHRVRMISFGYGKRPKACPP
jgi:hypothetical protein